MATTDPSESRGGGRTSADDERARSAPGDICGTAPVRLLDAERADRLAATFTALSSPARVRLLALIAGEPDGTVCACHLPGELGISQPTLSHHLRRLVDAGLLEREQRGRWAHYTLTPGALDDARAFLTAWTAAH